jgi:hypothetical protein
MLFFAAEQKIPLVEQLLWTFHGFATLSKWQKSIIDTTYNTMILLIDDLAEHLLIEFASFFTHSDEDGLSVYQPCRVDTGCNGCCRVL